LGTEHLGLYVGLAGSLDGLGRYGRTLKASLTLYEYLSKSISLYNMLTTGQRFWLSEHGKDLRFNIATDCEPGLGAYQSHCETLVITLTKFKEGAGWSWLPREISLAYRSRENLPDVELFSDSKVIRGTGKTYFTFPRAFLGLHFPRNGRGDHPETNLDPHAAGQLPLDLVGLVELQIESLLPTRAIEIDLVAESLAMSRRGLQRSLAQQALTYSQILAATRMRLAARWLARSDKPIAEIAFDLGYNDSSNFTRAFRRQAGASPQAFRDNLKS